MKPINMGKLRFSENKKTYSLDLNSKKQKFESLQEAMDFSNSKLREMAKQVQKDLTITIVDKDKYLSSNLVVKKTGSKYESEVISRSLFTIENRKYFKADQIERYLPLRKINPNGVAKTNISRSRKYRKVFLSLFTLLAVTAAVMFIFSILKVNGVGQTKIEILKKLMHGLKDHDVFTTWIAIAAFCIATVMIAHSLFILYKKREIRKFGTFKNEKWSKLYINNELRKRMSITALIFLLAFSIVQVALVHDSYVFSIRNQWYVAMIIIVATYLQVVITGTLLAFMLFDFITSKLRFRRRIKIFFNMHYRDFLRAVKAGIVDKETANLFKDKDMAVRVKGIETRFPGDVKLAETRVFRLPSQTTRKKLWAQEKLDVKHINETLKTIKKETKVA